MIYGYCRISTCKQNIERQERNIKAVCPAAVIIKEAFTGTKIQGRKGLDRIISNIKRGDMIIFDSVSRMSRNAEEGFDLYQDLFNKGVESVVKTFSNLIKSWHKIVFKFNKQKMEKNSILFIYLKHSKNSV